LDCHARKVKLFLCKQTKLAAYQTREEPVGAAKVVVLCGATSQKQRKPGAR
jgi:hypothetical protein